MSIFRNIKGTFQSVQQDLTAGFGLFSSSKEKSTITSREPTSVSFPPAGVNYEAGADILNKYQNIWKELHKYCEENSRKAENVDILIGSLYVEYDRSAEFVGKLHEELSNLPKMLQKIQEVTDTLAQVEEEYDKVESTLVRLQNICEEEELLKAKASHESQLRTYQDKRFKELNKVKVQLAKEHVQKVQLFEKKHQSQLKERQTVFQEVFEHDLEQYKKHGRIEKLPSTSDSEQKLDLEDFVPEESSHALEEFFEDDDVGISPDSGLDAVEKGNTDLQKNEEMGDNNQEEEIDEEEKETNKYLVQKSEQEGAEREMEAEEQIDLNNCKNEENTPVFSSAEKFKGNAKQMETESSQETMQTTDDAETCEKSIEPSVQ